MTAHPGNATMQLKEGAPRPSMVVLHTALDAAGWDRVSAVLAAVAASHPHPLLIKADGRSADAIRARIDAAEPTVILCWGVDAGWFAARYLPHVTGGPWREGPGGLLEAPFGEGRRVVATGATEDVERLVAAVA